MHVSRANTRCCQRRTRCRPALPPRLRAEWTVLYAGFKDENGILPREAIRKQFNGARTWCVRACVLHLSAQARHTHCTTTQLAVRPQASCGTSLPSGVSARGSPPRRSRTRRGMASTCSDGQGARSVWQRQGMVWQALAVGGRSGGWYKRTATAAADGPRARRGRARGLVVPAPQRWLVVVAG